VPVIAIQKVYQKLEGRSKVKLLPERSATRQNFAPFPKRELDFEMTNQESQNKSVSEKKGMITMITSSYLCTQAVLSHEKDTVGILAKS